MPQNSDASAKPHSAVPNAGSSERTWKMPMAVSDPCGTTAKHTYWPACRCRIAQLMKRPKPSTVAGGGEMNLRHLLARQRREQRRRIARAQLAQADQAAGQARQPACASRSQPSAASAAPIAVGVAFEMRLIGHLFH